MPDLKSLSLQFDVGHSKNFLVSKEDYKKMYQTGQLKARKVNINFVAEKPAVSNKVVAEFPSQPTFGQI
jgi:hypothetical protein